MRVALVVHCYFPRHFFGTEAYARSVARELARRGHEPTVVAATFAGEPRQASLVERSVHDGVPVVRIDRNLRPSAGVRDTYRLDDLRAVHERALRALRPDVVHVCHLINHTASFLDVTRALGLPTFATFTDFFGFCFTNKLQDASGALCAGPDALRANCIECALAAGWTGDGLARLARRPAFRSGVSRRIARRPWLAGARAADVEALKERPDALREAYRTYRAAVAPSRLLLDAYRQNGFEGPMELSHFGVDIDRSPKPARPDGPVVVGYVGQLAPHKGVHVVLEAFRAAGPGGLRLEIWGDEAQDGRYAGELRRAADGLDVAFRGTFPVAEVDRVLAGIDVLAIPSTWHENSPLILLQALATHTPVLVSDVEGLTEFVAPGESGFAFPAGEAPALAAILRRFRDDRTLAARMSATTRYDRTTAVMVDDLLGAWARHGVGAAAPGAEAAA